MPVLIEDSCVVFGSCALNCRSIGSSLTTVQERHFHRQILTMNRGIVKLIYPAQHLWLRALPNVMKVPTKEMSSFRMTTARDRDPTDLLFTVELGLTLRGLDEVGDVISIQTIASPRDEEDHEYNVKAGDRLIKINWEGHSISSADELYHTVWHTYSGETILHSPLAGSIVDRIMDDERCNLDEDTVLVRIMTSLDTLDEAIRNYGLVEENEYTTMLTSTPPGRFAEV